MTSADEVQDFLISRVALLDSRNQDLVAEIVAVLREGDSRLVEVIRSGFERVRTTRGLRQLLGRVQDVRRQSFSRASEALNAILDSTAREESDALALALVAAIGIEGFSLSNPTLGKLRSTIRTRPFQGRTVAEWVRSLEEADSRRIQATLTTAFTDGVSTGEEAASLVRGTRAARFSDGALATTTRQTDAVVRTALIHTLASVHAEWGEANKKTIAGLKWSSVLDTRTTPICMDRDGRVTMFGDRPVPQGFKALIPPDARPPAHVRCRSGMAYVLDPVAIVGNRPFVAFRGETVRFRQEAQLKAGRKWSQLTEKQRRQATADFRRAWALEHIGAVPQETNYSQFLSRQPAETQNQVLGVFRAQAFRDGVPLDRLITRSGRLKSRKELNI